MANKRRQHSLRRGFAPVIQKEVLPAHHFALAHKENLHRRQTFSLRHCHRQHIQIIAARVHILLALHQLNCGNPVAQLGGLLKTQLLRGFVHLFLQICQHTAAFALQKLHHLPAHLPVGRLIHLAGAWGQATANMIVQTRAFLLPKTAVGATAQRENLPQQLLGNVHCARADVRAKIAATIIFYGAHLNQPRVFLAQRHRQIGIVLIIPQHNVIFGSVLLNQIAFQHQGFHRRGNHNPFQFLHHPHLGGSFGSQAAFVLKVRTYSLLEGFRLAHVNHLTVGVTHNVHARTSWKFC